MWVNSKDSALRARAENVIPGGMYGHQAVGMLPDDYPQFFSRGKGGYVWDADGNRYLDFVCGYGPNLFGYAHEAIDQASIDRTRLGDTLTGPGEVMVELAETLVGMVEHAAWAMFCKNGTDATTMALVIARHHTGKKTIIRAKGAYHGAAPWCTPNLSGVTPEDRAHQLFYDYNDVESLEAAVREAGNDLAAIFASPIKHDVFVDQKTPTLEYARRARALCDEHGALLIIDDVRAGFRLARDCSWSLVGVNPDLSSWGKAIANGHPISALLGSEACRSAAAGIFATGSYWFSSAPMAASLATLKLIRETTYLEHTIALGERLRAGLNESASRHGFGLRQTGPAQMPLIMFEDDHQLSQSYHWNNTLIRRGVYMHPWHNMFMCAALTDADIDQGLDVAEDAFKALRAAGPLGPVPKLQAALARLAP